MALTFYDPQDDPRGGEVGAARRARSAASWHDTRTWRDPNGRQLSDRVWNARHSTRQAIDETLTQAIITGEDPLITADKLERWLNPSLMPRRDVAGRLVEGQSKRIVTLTPRPKSGSGPGLDGAGSYPARRLARTEIMRAHGIATIEAAKRNPFVRGVKWRLSGNHSRADECDRKARGSSRGMERGVYEPGDVPRYPSHPQCRCTLSPVTIEDTDAVIRDLRRELGLDGGAEPSTQKSDLTRQLDQLPVTADFPDGLPTPFIEQNWRDLGWEEYKKSRYDPDTRTDIQVFRSAVRSYAEPHGEKSYTAIRATLESYARNGKGLYPAVDAEARIIARTIAEADQIPVPLYRGTFSRSMDPPASLGTVGDTISLPGTSSFSARREVADGFRKGTGAGSGDHIPTGPNHETTFVIEPGAQGIKVDSLTVWRQSEVITGGEFEIMDVAVAKGKRKNGRAYTHTTYTLRQTSVLAPIA